METGENSFPARVVSKISRSIDRSFVCSSLSVYSIIMDLRNGYCNVITSFVIGAPSRR